MLSVVVPTRNHPEFLERTLHYYAGQRLREKMLVADSSDTDSLAQTTRILEKFPRLFVRHCTFDPALTVATKLARVLEQVDTEYVVSASDDDFFTMTGLRQSVEFLESNPEFSTVHGEAVLFEVKPGPVYGTELSTASYRQRSIEETTAAQRLLNHFDRYSTNWYSVHRTDSLRRNMKTVAQANVDPAHFEELLASGLSVIDGKSRKLSTLYVVRQTHGRSRGHYPDVFDWISAPGWGEHYGRLEDFLAAALSSRDGIPMELAKETVKQAFWSYLVKALSSKWRQRYQGRSSLAASLKSRLASKAPGLAPMWQRVQSVLGGAQSEMLLPSLLQSSSRHHADFMPIYEAIRGGATR